MDDIFVYTVPMPDSVHEAVVPCVEGYNVYLSSRLCAEQRIQAYLHALKHIKDGDCFNESDVQTVEQKAHIA